MTPETLARLREENRIRGIQEELDAEAFARWKEEEWCRKNMSKFDAEEAIDRLRDAYARNRR